MAQIKVALAGNPNAGKTSIFNELTGSNQYVGNWPGVTVEKKEGTLKKNKDVLIQDLPGIYSLSPYTPEEIISRDYLLNGKPDVVVDVIDSTNLERNLYLTTQLLELGIPVLIDLNMTDLLHRNGDSINVEKLSYSLNSKVVETSASSGKGIKELIKMVMSKHEIVDSQMPEYPLYDNRCEVALDEIQGIIEPLVPRDQLRWYTIKVFERDELVKSQIELSAEQQAKIEDVITTAEEVFGDDSDSIIINERYEFIAEVVQLCRVTSSNSSNMKLSDKIDRVVTNRWLGLPIFALVMFLIYYLSIQTLGTMGTDWVNDVLFGEIIPNGVSGALESWNVAGWMQSLILDGIIAGVGAVLGFLPQIIVMFLCLAFLEDCGYMARVAFVMDRIFRKFGLSGKSFIPMLISVGCGVPGVMASRTIENEKDRRMTVMVTTMMPCSAKLPIIALITGAFFPNNPFIFPSAYFVGMGAIVFSGIVLKKTSLFSGDPAPFIMELPAYHLPKLKGVLLKTWERSSAFVKKAGTIILASSIVLWFLLSFNFKLQMVSQDKSILAGIGSVVAFIFAPLGWGDWRATVAAVTGLIAKENIVNTFGILFKGLSEVSENGEEVWGSLRASFTPIAAYSFLLFNLLCAPCFAAIGAIHREMADTKWTLIAVGYQCGLAYVVSFVFYQIAALFVYGTFGIGQILGVILLIGMVYVLFRKPKRKNDLSLKLPVEV